MKYYFIKETPIGKLTIIEETGVILAVCFGEARQGEEKQTSVIKQASIQLTEYFNGKRRAFDLPLKPEGTSFQKKVWAELAKIPYGETRTYGQIADAIGNKKAVRAVGGANNKNKIAIIIPCHRVIGASGKLVGYAGGVDIKESLLNLEKNSI